MLYLWCRTTDNAKRGYYKIFGQSDVAKKLEGIYGKKTEKKRVSAQKQAV
jgi:hypothetical protein